ncbi:TIGR02391 family protein [Micromonospora inositola]|uniref:Conserved hypothetical protein CHP02391 domain-containing protein n=1 Tax=Micromonospora inositola TaxID=47865 RepID=A0A1C5HCP8_9ACTN|nr:TIGR02391 family protein [Micromonospora inositola]SCG43627.1 Protein of unknown function (Hypoth_ymh) [Micromonospora inositola]
MDSRWAIAEIDEFLALTELRPASLTSRRRANRGRDGDIIAKAQVVEQILDRVVRGWRRDSVSGSRNISVNRWCQHMEAAERARAELVRREEIREKLGDNAPELNAARLHPWIWDGARSLWQSQHYREAVRAATIKLNAETQNKTGRFDISETDLFKQTFTTDSPQPGKPRLRLVLQPEIVITVR